VSPFLKVGVHYLSNFMQLTPLVERPPRPHSASVLHSVTFTLPSNLEKEEV